MYSMSLDLSRDIITRQSPMWKAVSTYDAIEYILCSNMYICPRTLSMTKQDDYTYGRQDRQAFGTLLDDSLES